MVEDIIYQRRIIVFPKNEQHSGSCLQPTIPCILRLHTTTTQVVTSSMKHILQAWCSEQGLHRQWTAIFQHRLSTLCREWIFVQPTCFHYPQSYRLVERSVQIVKRVMNKAKDGGTDIYQSLLVFHTTPLDSLRNVACGQTFTSRRTC